MLNELAQRVHENAKSKGFFENEKNIGEMLCLIHSEVSEALEADRKKQYYANSDVFKVGLIKEMTEKELGAVFFEESVFKAEFERSVKNTFEDELADVVIRVLDLCAFKGIDIESHIKAKMRYNAGREFKHGKAY